MDATELKISLSNANHFEPAEITYFPVNQAGEILRFSPQKVASLRGQFVAFVPYAEVWRRNCGLIYSTINNLPGRGETGSVTHSLQNPIKNIIQRPT